jgi:hypothetical protein
MEKNIKFAKLGIENTYRYQSAILITCGKAVLNPVWRDQNSGK